MTIGVDPIYRMMNGKPVVIGYVVVNQTARAVAPPYDFRVQQLVCETTAVKARVSAARYAGAKTL